MRAPAIPAARQDEAVARYLAGAGIKTLADELGCSTHPVVDLMHARGVMRRRGSAPAAHRADVFERMTRDDLYWLGLLWADGSLSGNRLTLSLRHDDGDHVASFGRFLGVGHTPRRYLDQTRISVSSDPISTRVANLGFTKNPREPIASLYDSPDFWRGLIDGDGSVLLYNRPVLRLNGYQALTTAFLDYARAAGADTKAIARPHASITRAQLSGPAAVRMIQLLYGDAPVALPRKLATARKVLAA